MNVSELIGLLEECDPEAEVRIMSQENWPFENAIRGIAVREDLFTCEFCGGAAYGAPGGLEPGLSVNDVFIVEGAQERYGSKLAWENVRR